MHGQNVDNSMLEFLLDLLQTKMCDSSSKYYLPNLVPQLKDPNLDPYTTTDSWPLSGLTGPSIVTASGQICLQATPDKYLPAVGIGDGGPSITLSNITIAGLPNVLPEKPVVIDPKSNAPQVIAVLDFCTIVDAPSLSKVITFTGSFTLSQNCCIPPRGSMSCGTGDPKFNTSGDGTFTTTLSTVSGTAIPYKLQMTCNSVITVQANQEFLVTVTSIETNIPIEAMSTSVTINTSGKGDKKTYEKLANEALNNNGTKQQILAYFNSIATSDNVKQEVGNAITDQLNGLLLDVRKKNQTFR